jgi:hypothetical protein
MGQYPCDFGFCDWGIGGNQLQAQAAVNLLFRYGPTVLRWVQWCLSTPGCVAAVRVALTKGYESVVQPALSSGKAASDAAFGCIDAPCIQKALQNIQQQQENGTWAASGGPQQQPVPTPSPKAVPPRTGGAGGTW